MRLWHLELIDVLPRQQLLSQWRELSAIVGSIEKNGTPNHLLVNKVLDYPSSHLFLYAGIVKDNMEKRGYKVNYAVIEKITNYCVKAGGISISLKQNEIFDDWHNKRYLCQCLYNLQEKYDCGGITEQEWQLIVNKFGKGCV